MNLEPSFMNTRMDRHILHINIYIYTYLLICIYVYIHVYIDSIYIYKQKYELQPIMADLLD